MSAAFPGVVRQIGYVVADFDASIASRLALGVGPWFVLRGRPQAGLYRGQPCEVTLSVAFANSGDLQIELIHQDDETPSIYLTLGMGQLVREAAVNWDGSDPIRSVL